MGLPRRRIERQTMANAYRMEVRSHRRRFLCGAERLGQERPRGRRICGWMEEVPAMRRAFLLRLALLLGLTLGMLPGAWSTQSGGSGAVVPSILVGQTLPGEIRAPQDAVTYRFEASAGVAYRLEVVLDGLPAAGLSLRAS